MSQYNHNRKNLSNDESPSASVVCGGMGSVAQKFDMALQSRDIHVFKDNSTDTLLTQLYSSGEVPEELLGALVDIYSYFLDMASQIKQHTSNSGGDK